MKFEDPRKLVFFCGKMGAGKSTLAKQIAEEKDGILISEDDLRQE